MDSRVVPRNGRWRALTLSLVAWALLLLGCTPPPRPQAPERLRVVVDPSAAPLFEQLAAQYHADHSYLSFEVSERNADAALGAVTGGEADLALVERDLEAAEAFNADTWRPRLHAWPIGRGALAVVVHPSNPVQQLSPAELQAAFGGVVRNWASLGGENRTLTLVTREATAPSRLLLEREVLQQSALAGTALIMPNDAAVAEYVAAHPEAMGCLAAPWARDGVRVLAVEGAFPDLAAVAAGSYPLTYPLALVTPTAVSGKAKAFIDYCLSREGQAIVGQSYAPLP